MNSEKFDSCIVVDDDEDILLAARLLMRQLFADVRVTPSPQEALDWMGERRADVVLLDANFARGATDGSEGFRWLGRILDRDPHASVVLITAHGGVQTAVEAMKQGATDFVSKPWANDKLLSVVRSAAALSRSRRQSEATPAKAPTPSSETPLLGSSPAMARVLSLIEKAGPTDANVLILGENGTGKELVARELHRHSRRAGKIMLSVDLGAVAENLFDSELFGHVKGAFTDARADRVGRLQAADGGTLFLDEVGNLPLHLQPKLLTALEQREVLPVGSNKPIPIDVRVVAATNSSADHLADEKRFRQDLLFRLNTIEIELPPLRERREDVPILLDHYLSLYARKYDKPQRALPPAVTEALVRHDWPGNVRALRHAAERAVIMADGESYRLDDFPLPQRSEAASLSVVGDSLNLDQLEKQMIERALRMHHFNVSLAASELGLSRGALYRRMEKHGL